MTKRVQKNTKKKSRVKIHTRTKKLGLHTKTLVRTLVGLHTKKLVGGFKEGVSCESEGCVFYPSIINTSHPLQSVTKLYKKENIYEVEVAKYVLFDKVDPDYTYHCRILSSGTINSDKLSKIPPYFNANTIYPYLDMEYAGVAIVDMTNDNNTDCFKQSLLDFLKGVLQLRVSENGPYVIHGDPHAGNICFLMNRDCPTIKYIDITSAAEVLASDIIAPTSTMKMQFASMVGVIRHVFGFAHPLAKTLADILLNANGKEYGVVVNQFLDVLKGTDVSTHVSSPVTSPVINKPIKGTRRVLYDTPDSSPDSSQISKRFQFYSPDNSPDNRFQFGSPDNSPVKRIKFN